MWKNKNDSLAPVPLLLTSTTSTLNTNSNSNNHMPPILLSPVRVDQVLPPAANSYPMQHLLASGFSGTEYQLLVLLAKLIHYKAHQPQINYIAGVEIKGFGNLDDIGIIMKNDQEAIQCIETYQVKHYNHPIKIEDFFNKQEADGKNNKMHIGKFFDGWLRWREKYPLLNMQNLHAIVYSNAELAPLLQNCIEGGKFKTEFIEHTTIFHASAKTEEDFRIFDKFFISSDKKLKISTQESRNIYNQLKTHGLIGSNNYLTAKYEQQKENIQELNLPSHISLEHVQQKLLRKYKSHQEYLRRIDFWNLLYTEAWAYLQKESPDLTAEYLTDAAKIKTFVEFLQSLSFKPNQLTIEQLEIQIQNDIKHILHKLPAQIFLCLYYTIHEWFRRETKANKPWLTPGIMHHLLEEASLRSIEIVLLQGRSQAALSHIFNVIEEQHVKREAQQQLLRTALEKPGLYMVIGEKGVGKSGLVKYTLNNLPEMEYLVLTAIDLCSDAELRHKLMSVTEKIAVFRIIVIDGAEALLSLSAKEVHDLLNNLQKHERTLILTLTPEARDNDIFQVTCEDINIPPLTIESILKTFPYLAPYESISPLMHLIRIPFYLKAVVALVANGKNSHELNYLLSMQTITLEVELIKLVVQGKNAQQAAKRKIAWHHLALKVNEQGINKWANLPYRISELQFLLDEGIIIREDQRYRFSHDLFAEAGLMSFWFQKWEIAYTEGQSNDFWKNLKIYGDKNTLFEKWISLYHVQLNEDIQACISTIVATPYFTRLVGISILLNLNSWLTQLLTVNNSQINHFIDRIASYSHATYLLLALWSNNAEAINILVNHGALLHHPNAGIFTKDTFYKKSCYTTPNLNIADLENEENSDERSTSENSDSEDESSEEDAEEEWEGASHSSKSSDYDQFNQVENEYEEILKKLVDSPCKYWSAGFDEKPGWYDEDEFGYIENSLYESSPDYSKSYIHQAIMDGDHAAGLTALIDNYLKADQSCIVNLINNCDETPLHLAALKKAHECADVLIMYGAQVNRVDRWEETPLHNAAYLGDIQMAILLLEHNADPNARNHHGFTPLHIAIIRLDIELVKVLLQYAADLCMPPFLSYPSLALLDILECVSKASGFYRKTLQEVENFSIKLIEVLNFGYNNQDFIWGDLGSAEFDAVLCQNQLNQVEQLLLFVGDRVKISDNYPKFDYYDEATKETFLKQIAQRPVLNLHANVSFN